MDEPGSSQIKEENNDTLLIESALSGGNFQIYLQDMLNSHGEKIRLMLRWTKRIFDLPCRDGQGRDISADELKACLEKHRSSYSEALCTNYILLQDVPAVVLYDDEASMRTKAEIASAMGIVCLEHNKNKTP